MMTLGTITIRRNLFALAFIAATVTTCLAGRDVSFEQEFQRLQEIKHLVDNHPAYRESQDLKQQILELQTRIERLELGNPDEIGAELKSIRKQTDTLGRRLGQLRKIVVQFREQISKGKHERFYPGARNRIASFTFDDPHHTGIGDSVSFLLSKKLLFSTRVSSFAVVNYRQGTDSDTSSKLAYFDRVDAITDDQGFLLALWGRLSETDEGVRVDTFLQVPANVDGPYVRSINLPEAMGGGRLTVRLKPDRILLQSLHLGRDQIGTLREAAVAVANLRSEPSASAAVTGNIPEDQPYRIVDSQGEWVRLSFDTGVAGWTNVETFCAGVCSKLLEAAIFTNDIVALASGLSARPPPLSVTREAAAASDQLAALVALPDDPRKALEIAERWMPRSATEGQPGTGPPPGGAGFANLLAVARVATELEFVSAGKPNFERIKLDQELIRDIADNLSRASIHDPGDIDVVENLAVLFGYLGDERRRGLALEIAEGLRAR